MKAFLFTTFLFTTLFTSVFAQSSGDTIYLHSVSEVVTLALRNNPTQSIYQQQIKKATYDYKALEGYIYPHATGSFDGTTNLHLPVTPIPGKLFGRADSTIYVQFGKRYVYNSGITFSEDVFDWQSLLQKRIAEGNIELNQMQQASYEQTIKMQTAQAYYAALIAKASLAIAATDKLLADSLVALSKQRFSEGATDAISVNSTLINANNIAQNKEQSAQLYDQEVDNLKLLLGAKRGSILLLMDAVAPDSMLQLETLTLGEDKSLAVYQQQATIASLQSKAQQSIAYPKLSATAYLGVQQFRDDFGLGFYKGAWNGYRYIGVDVSVPFFTGLTNSNKYKSAVTQKNIAQLQYENARQQSEINDSLLLKNYAHFITIATSSAQNFTLYKNSLQLNKQKFDEGIISTDVYVKSFQDYLAAENNYLNSLSQLLSTKSSILSRQ